MDLAAKSKKQGNGLHVRIASVEHSGQRMRCRDPMERLYYSCGLFSNSEKLCAVCGQEDEGAAVEEELENKFKTVLPLCPACKALGSVPAAYGALNVRKGAVRADKQAKKAKAKSVGQQRLARG